MNRKSRMPRTFAYCRVSTAGQTVENQVREIEAAGFSVQRSRTIGETVSGSSAIVQRPGFMKLLDRPEADDVLDSAKGPRQPLMTREGRDETAHTCRARPCFGTHSRADCRDRRQRDPAAPRSLRCELALPVVHRGASLTRRGRPPGLRHNSLGNRFVLESRFTCQE